MKRKLRPSIRFMLECITITLGIMLVSINDFSMSALPFILIAIGIEFMNIKILEKF